MADYNYFERLTESLDQALAHNRGDNTKARTVIRERMIPEYQASDIYRMRTTLSLSQRSLAVVLGVSPRTIEAWEAGRNTPSGPAARMLYLIESDNSLVDKLSER